MSETPITEYVEKTVASFFEIEKAKVRLARKEGKQVVGSLRRR